MNKLQANWLRDRVIVILVQLAKNEGLSLKEVGLYQMPNKRKNIIIDQYGTVVTRATVEAAYTIAKEEMPA